MAKKTDIHSPLLTAQEIKQLISSAAASSQQKARLAPLGNQPGEWISPRQGGGSDFAETRAYYAGDDPRRIDWRATARSRIPLIRTYHAELKRPYYLLVDRCASMHFGTRCRLKVTQAVRAAIWLASREIRASREIAAVSLDTPVHWLPAQQGMRAINSLVELINHPCPPIDVETNAPSWSQLFGHLRQRLPQGSNLLLLSDFSQLNEHNEFSLRSLAAHCNIQAIQLFDPIERQLPLTDNLQLCWQNNCIQIGENHSAVQFTREQQQTAEQQIQFFQKVGISYRTLSTETDDLSILAGRID